MQSPERARPKFRPWRYVRNQLGHLTLFMVLPAATYVLLETLHKGLRTGVFWRSISINISQFTQPMAFAAISAGLVMLSVTLIAGLIYTAYSFAVLAPRDRRRIAGLDTVEALADRARYDRLQPDPAEPNGNT